MSLLYFYEKLSVDVHQLFFLMNWENQISVQVWYLDLISV